MAESSPRSVALVAGDRSVTYEELNCSANQLANYLREHENIPDVPVAIYLERSIELIVAVLGVLKAGRAYVPLTIEQPSTRLAFLLRDAAPQLLITRSKIGSRLPEHRSQIVYLDEHAAHIARCPATNPAVAVHPSGLAYCIYTSGSTGQPKCVQIPHSGIGLLGREQVAWFDITSSDRILQFASFGFDAFVFELVMALTAGATLVLPTQDIGAALVREMAEKRVSVATLPPSLLGRLDLTGVSSLRAVISAGESCRASAMRSIPSGCRFINAYGPTETTIWATAYRSVGVEVGELPIGRPISNVQVYILDEMLDPVPIGVAGEIHIAGAGVARGYLGRPQLTAEKFIPNPFGVAGSRMYKTGDLGRYLPDGNIEFLGRIDHQVKIRGYRIELGEIENALSRCEGVREAVVVAREDEPGNKRLIAYVVAQGVRPATDALRVQLQQFLPEYMLPAIWMFMDALPLNASGKVDRNALPEPDGSEQDAIAPQSMEADPGTETQREVLALMRSIVPSELMRADSNFLDVGFHSIHLMRLVGRCRARFGVRLTITEAATASCARRLAEIIERRQCDQSISTQDSVNS